MGRSSVAARAVLTAAGMAGAAAAAIALSAATAISGPSAPGGVAPVATGALCEGASATVVGQTHAIGPLCVGYSLPYVCASPSVGAQPDAEVSVTACAPD